METLAQFITAENTHRDPGQRTLEAWAREFGISRSYLSEILNGKSPGRDTIAKIDAATGGRVPPSVWFQSGVAAE
jgi:transcriptional regulator with XRE-family HTH domain